MKYVTTQIRIACLSHRDIHTELAKTIEERKKILEKYKEKKIVNLFSTKAA